MLDSKLTFSAHIKYAADKALKLLLKYYPILNKKSSLSSSNKLNIYKVIVRPAMLYASPVWSMTCQSNLHKLQIQQNKFLRLAGNYRRYTEINKMHRDLNIETVFDYIKNVMIKYFDKIAGHENPFMRNLKVSSGRHKNVKHILK